jgi:hypothetical protein
MSPVLDFLKRARPLLVSRQHGGGAARREAFAAASRDQPTRRHSRRRRARQGKSRTRFSRSPEVDGRQAVACGGAHTAAHLEYIARLLEN